MVQITITNKTETMLMHEMSPDSNTRLLSGKWKKGINQIPTFDFTITPQNPCFAHLHNRRTIVKVQDLGQNKTEFEGYILQGGDDADGSMSASGIISKSVTCEGYLGYLRDSIQEWHHYPAGTSVQEFLRQLLENHNRLVSPEKQIHPGLCDMTGTASRTTSYGTTLDEIKRLLTERIGGEIRVRNEGGVLFLDYLQRIGTYSETPIELGNNLQDISVSTDCTGIITRLIPLGKQMDDTAARLTVSEVNDGKSYIDDETAIAKYGIICGTQTWDDVELPQNLLHKGMAYLSENNRVKHAYTIHALDLSVIRKDYSAYDVGNTHPVLNGMLGMADELRITDMAVDIYAPYKPSLTIGDKLTKITDVVASTRNYIQYDVPMQRSEILESAKTTASDLVQAGINGNITVNPDEILIMDTPDKSTAARVWRWTSGGFGYSSAGYGGPYETAMTMDGEITADFIKNGTLHGIEISNGAFHVDPAGNVLASNMTVTGGSICADAVTLEAEGEPCSLTDAWNAMTERLNELDARLTALYQSS